MKEDALKAILGKLTHSNCCSNGPQNIIAKFTSAEMDRTVFPFFFPEMNVPRYPQTKDISKKILSDFFNNNFMKNSKTSKKKNIIQNKIILSLRDIELKQKNCLNCVLIQYLKILTVIYGILSKLFQKKTRINYKPQTTDKNYNNIFHPTFFFFFFFFFLLKL